MAQVHKDKHKQAFMTAGMMHRPGLLRDAQQQNFKHYRTTASAIAGASIGLTPNMRPIPTPELKQTQAEAEKKLKEKQALIAKAVADLELKAKERKHHEEAAKEKEKSAVAGLYMEIQSASAGDWLLDAFSSDDYKLHLLVNLIPPCLRLHYKDQAEDDFGITATIILQIDQSSRPERLFSSYIIITSLHFLPGFKDIVRGLCNVKRFDDFMTAFPYYMYAYLLGMELLQTKRKATDAEDEGQQQKRQKRQQPDKTQTCVPLFDNPIDFTIQMIVLYCTGAYHKLAIPMLHTPNTGQLGLRGTSSGGVNRTENNADRLPEADSMSADVE